MNLPMLILASGSPRRSGLLRQLNLDFQVIAGEAAEIHHEQLTACELCQVNACRKARSVAQKHPDALVLGADTLVCLEDELLGKPAGLAEARQMLERLQGRTHEVITGVCLMHWRSHRQKIFVEGSSVTFKPLAEEKIDRYLASINPLDKAGAYAIQENGDQIVENVAGSFSNVVGLPLERLRQELESW